ncbi:Wzz/FepE/Etk N-terminal domain-containing protein [Wenzhouxiangella sp. XN24]|uniref:Wzz/FepE/Etk N-terminal domain-containing protein n=1 Tax=Wenzhouxiangella sp. XN24 TaxID=2713569 RepID=UPI0013ED8715|nr:Wzz/FepE/Etk N-terminal domain-containing protein [Wenzhouxiangella sp. XN24]NGX17012.1 hypothetical protein [Wenzhouxiangella sp. XN24]
MADKPPEERVAAINAPAGASERLVYVMPEHLMRDSSDDEIDLRELWGIIWAGKWRIIAVTVLFATASVAYALLATEWYRAEALLAPAEEKSAPSLGGQLGGLAALAGLSIGGGDSVDAIATLKSRELAKEFISDNQLLPILFRERWDASNSRWIGDDPDTYPDERDAVRFFHQHILQVSEDRKSGLTTVAIEWHDPDLAAAWATQLVEMVNDKLRERALAQAEANVAYLQLELAKTSVVTLQHAIGRLLETELQKVMLARGNNEFAFRVIDAAQSPKYRASPKRSLIAIVGTLVGGLLGLLWVFVANAFRSH